MAVAKAKAKRRGDRLNARIEEWTKFADERYKYAQRIIELNGPDASDTVEKMVEVMQRMQTDPRFKIDGVYVAVDRSQVEDINYKLHVWIAVRLLSAAAQWDIRISGFKLSKSRCAKCGKKVSV